LASLISVDLAGGCHECGIAIVRFGGNTGRYKLVVRWYAGVVTVRLDSSDFGLGTALILASLV
jgi:hypothetical protein